MRYVVTCLLVLTCTTLSVAEQKRIYIGTYTRGDSLSKGIYTCRFDDQNGTLTEPTLAVETDNPSFLAVHPSGKFVFACNEVSDFSEEASGAMSAFQVNSETGTLALLNQQPTGGGAPCHCVVNQSGQFVLFANYLGGNVGVMPVNSDGSLSPRSCLINHIGRGPNARRQTAPHAHSINVSSDDRFAYAADLGIDRIIIYRFDNENGRLVPSAADSVAVRPGGGPRHFCIHPDQAFAYCNLELTSEVVAFSRDPKTGKLKVLQVLSTLPKAGFARNSTAECVVHPSGRFLYVSNRGHDSIACYTIDQKSGKLTLQGIRHTEGKEPRNFFVTPCGMWLLAENQNSDTVVVFKIDTESGLISPTRSRISVPKPVCIRMLP